MDHNEELDSCEDGESEASGGHAAKKRRIVMLLLACSAILGIIGCFLPEDDKLLDFIVGLPLLILGIAWCFTDAAERDHRIGRVTKLLLALFFIVGLPIYMIQTRGIGAIKTLSLATVLVGAMCACVFVTEYATLYVGEIAGFWEIAF